MSVANLLVFAGAYLAAVLLPGPAVTALVARVLARGARGAPAYIAGCAAGSLLWFAVAATGMAALAASFATVFVAVRFAAAGYLLYLAWKLWTAPPRAMAQADTSPEGWGRVFLSGLGINLGNPKAVVFFLALLPAVVNIGTLTLPGFAAIAATIAAIVAGVFAGYTVLAARARRLFTSGRAQRVANRTSATVLAGAAAMIVTR